MSFDGSDRVHLSLGTTTVEDSVAKKHSLSRDHIAILGTRGVPKTILTITGTTLGFSGLEAKPREKISRALSRGLWSESDPTINVDWLAMTPMTPQTPQLAPLHRPYFPTKPV